MTGSNKATVVEVRSGGRAYRAGVAVALLTSFLNVWTTIVRDDGNGIGIFMVIMAAVVGGFAAEFRPTGMSRTMFGVAIMQATVGVLIATATVTTTLPDGAFRALLFSGGFGAMWLISAVFFRAAAKGDHKDSAPR